VIKTSCRDFSARKLSLQDYYERNQGLKTKYHMKTEGFICKKKWKGPLVEESKK
jgi:hypothetical protein